MKDRILANIKEAKAKGFTIVHSLFGDNEKEICCPLNAACVVEGAPVTTNERTLARFNNMEPYEVSQFIQGFDQDDVTYDTKWHDLGAELRAMLDRGEI